MLQNCNCRWVYATMECWELNMGPLQGHPVMLSADQSLASVLSFGAQNNELLAYMREIEPNIFDVISLQTMQMDKSDCQSAPE